MDFPRADAAGSWPRCGAGEAGEPGGLTGSETHAAQLLARSPRSALEPQWGRFVGIPEAVDLKYHHVRLVPLHPPSGEAWDLDSRDGGVSILPPYETQTGGAWYAGTADAITQNLDYIKANDPKYVLILSGDHLYRMDYRKMLKIVLDAGYHGYVGIEYEGGKISEPEGIRATKKLLEKVRAELAG